jgi:hypothetical protein
LWMTSDQIEERQIRSAYLTPGLYRKLPIEMASSFYLEPSGKQVLELAFAIPERSLVFLPREDRTLARLEVGATFRTGRDNIVDQFSRSVEVRLQANETSRTGNLLFMTRREMPPGDYDAVAVIRDLATDEVGAIRRQIKVPPLIGEHLAMSSLVLNSPDLQIRRVNIESGICENPQIAVPAVPPVFERGSDLVGSCLLYHPKREAKSGEARVEVTASIRRGAETVRRLPAYLHVVPAGMSTDGLPLQLPISLSDLDPGVYTFEIQVLDENAQRAVVQSVDFMLR